jgi:hypothetical protein
MALQFLWVLAALQLVRAASSCIVEVVAAPPPTARARKYVSHRRQGMPVVWL